MKKSRSTLKLFGTCSVLVILMGMVLAATPALAESLTVTGTDYFFGTGEDPHSVDILSVTGKEGETVYVNMARVDGQKSQTLASHLAYTLDDSAGGRDANGDVVGAVSVEFSSQAFSYDDMYSVEVYADRAETKALYKGTISTLFAQYGTNEPQALVVRTLADEEKRPLDVPQTHEQDGVTYELSAEDPKDVGGKPTYIYKYAATVAGSTEAHIAYVDRASGEQISSQSITLAKDESQSIAIPPIISGDNGKLYRTLQLSGNVTVAYPGVTDYSIMCQELSGEWGSVGSFFEASIVYVDGEGNNLGVADTVIVNKPYTYTAPNYLYVDESGTVKEYKLKGEGTLKLEPGQSDKKTEFQIAYEPVSDDAERTWTVVLENGSVSPKDPGRVIDRITYRGKPGEKATHATEQEIDVKGKSYVPTAAAQDSYEHTFGVADMEVEQTIYYVPKDYVAPEAYDITVKYVNIATNEVIDSETYTASPSMRSDLEITTPEKFSQGGIEWIRLNGQESPLRHGFYSSAREYVIYYRDVNDDLHAKTIIRTVRVVYVDEEGNTVTRPTTVVDNGTTTTGSTGEATDSDDSDRTNADEGQDATPSDDQQGEEGGEEVIYVAPSAPGDGSVDTGLQTGEDLRAIDGVDGNDGQAVVGQDGTDLATQRIEDDATPLAGPGSKEGVSKTNNQAMVIGGVAAGVAAAIGLIFFFVYKRRKRGTDESSNDDLTA